MKLYLCPVCEKSCKQERETCDDFKFNGSKNAEWIFDQDCPECSENNQMGMLFQDKYGALCAVTNCRFEQEYKKG